MGWPPEAPQGPSSCRFTRKTCFCKEKCFTQAHFFHKKRDKIRFSEQKFVFWVPMWLLQNRSLQLVTVPQLYIVGCVVHPPHCCPRWVLQVERLLAEEIRGLGVAAVPAVIKIDLNRQTSYSWQEEVGHSRSAFLQKFMITSCGAARLCKKKEKRKHKNPNPPLFWSSLNSQLLLQCIILTVHLASQPPKSWGLSTARGLEDGERAKY